MKQNIGLSSVIAFVALVYLLTFMMNLSGNQLLVVLSQITPLIATCCIWAVSPNSKQTFKQLGLGKTGKLRWYGLALLAGVPVMLSFIGAWMTGYVELPPAGNFPNGIEDQEGRFLFMFKQFFRVTFLSAPMIFALGEEIGWRGFLQSRLMEAAGPKKAFVYTGSGPYFITPST
ncbi:CPBP family intramembrane metalloprotease [Paenactinomyces guangxiensis]|uniref:CPBP family intramembrane metalloprotease n=1 Tax=Paenactinomyces guangxiensis TaxID=1490290 RepID=A0A7W1WPH0_9BACL|nr:CPBP family intramembrane metalloprotease [Paenactinomyces guangxiensis]MBA4493662.1 CPBP family intramembrane metalloprotease [Paenactinomyces guangxiensis]MBH8590949.1 CPBP family intramembrane metalloprotease [Paenactinomyces guangxiensis]